MGEIRTLYEAISGIIAGVPGASRAPRTRRLVSEGRSKMAKKVGEEGVEVALAGESGNKRHTIEESADLIYNMVALWANMGITPADVWAEMAKRRINIGIAEKLPKPNKLGQVKVKTKPIKGIKTKPKKAKKATSAVPLKTKAILPVSEVTNDTIQPTEANKPLV